MKGFYSCTNKNNLTKQLTQHERRGARLRAIRDKDPYVVREPTKKGPSAPRAERNIPTEGLRPEDHYKISRDANEGSVSLPVLVGTNEGDPALRVCACSTYVPLEDIKKQKPKGFVGKLKDHLLDRILGREYDGGERTYGREQRNAVIIANDMLHKHKTLQINYTTYDMRRERDTIHINRNRDFMMLSCETDYPYWFGRILGIYHASVQYLDPESVSRYRGGPKRMEFLHVRWFARMEQETSGWENRQPLALTFDDPEDAFGFVDPDMVIRAVHLIPGFAHGTDEDPLLSTIARPQAEEDYNVYYLH